MDTTGAVPIFEIAIASVNLLCNESKACRAADFHRRQSLVLENGGRRDAQQNRAGWRPAGVDGLELGHRARTCSAGRSPPGQSADRTTPRGIVVREVVEGPCAIKTVKFRVEPADNGWLYPEKCVKPETVASTGKVVH